MHKVVHFELPADDADRARTFYQQAFGWRTQSMPGMGYTLVFTTPTDEQGRPAEVGGINGGMLERQGPITAPVIVVEVDDIDAALAKVVELGGKTALGRQNVGDMGYSAYFVDPEGNVVGLWQNAG
jgi:hypothetical protein